MHGATMKVILLLTRVKRMYLSNTTLFDGRGMYIIYCISYNYMFRRLKMAIFRLCIIT